MEKSVVLIVFIPAGLNIIALTTLIKYNKQ